MDQPIEGRVVEHYENVFGRPFIVVEDDEGNRTTHALAIQLRWTQVAKGAEPGDAIRFRVDSIGPDGEIREATILGVEKT